MQRLIRCLSLPYYLATKFTAFKNRGGDVPRTSHDFEDIVYLLDHTSTLKNQILEADYKVRNCLIDCFKTILENGVQQEAIRGNLYYEEQDYRYNKIIKLIGEIRNSHR